MHAAKWAPQTIRRYRMEHVNPPRTLFDKLWKRHVVTETVDGPSLLYVDRHLLYEVTSPQAFEALRSSGRKAWRPETVLAAADHNVPTIASERVSVDSIADPMSRIQVRQLDIHFNEFGISAYG